MKIKLLNLILVLSSFIILQTNLNCSSTYAMKTSSNMNFKQNSENFKLKSRMIKLEDFFKELESIKQNETIKNDENLFICQETNNNKEEYFFVRTNEKEIINAIQINKNEFYEDYLKLFSEWLKNYFKNNKKYKEYISKSLKKSSPIDDLRELSGLVIQLLWNYINELKNNKNLNEIANLPPDLYEFIKCVNENFKKPCNKSWRALCPVHDYLFLKPSFDINCSVSLDQLTYDKPYPTIHYFMDISVLGEDRVIYLGSCNYINLNEKSFFCNEKAALKSCLFITNDETIKNKIIDDNKNYLFTNLYYYIKPFLRYGKAIEDLKKNKKQFFLKSCGIVPYSFFKSKLH